MNDGIDNSDQHDGEDDEKLDEERVVRLLVNDRVSEHPDHDEDNDDVGDKEQNKPCSTEGIARVDVGASGITPGSSNDAADECREKDNVDIAYGFEITIQSWRNSIPSTKPDN